MGRYVLEPQDARMSATVVLHSRENPQNSERIIVPQGGEYLTGTVCASESDPAPKPGWFIVTCRQYGHLSSQLLGNEIYKLGMTEYQYVREMIIGGFMPRCPYCANTKDAKSSSYNVTMEPRNFSQGPDVLAMRWGG